MLILLGCLLSLLPLSLYKLVTNQPCEISLTAEREELSQRAQRLEFVIISLQLNL